MLCTARLNRVTTTCLCQSGASGQGTKAASISPWAKAGASLQQQQSTQHEQHAWAAWARKEGPRQLRPCRSSPNYSLTLEALSAPPEPPHKGIPVHGARNQQPIGVAPVQAGDHGLVALEHC